MADRDLAAVVAALDPRQREVIERGTPIARPALRGLDAAAILTELHRQDAYAAETAAFLTANPDLAADPAAMWAALALIRCGHHVLTRPTVRELLTRTKGPVT